MMPGPPQTLHSGADKPFGDVFRTMGSRSPCIQARKLIKSYSSGGLSTPVLRGVSLDVQQGSFTALVGPSGCGKTTLLNLIGALDLPDDGELTVCSVNLSSATPAEIASYRRKTLGFVFQACNLLPTLTARENVELALEMLGTDRRWRTETTRKTLSQVGLERAAERFPAQLSGGEQQRVAIARALVKAPSLVVADEPTGSLDQANGREVIRLMKRINEERGITFLVVTHDPEVAREAQAVLRMEDGLVLSDGAHTAVHQR